jgi:hypothetical protein
MKFSLKQLTQQGSSEGLCVVAVMAATFTRRPLRRARDGFSNPSITPARRRHTRYSISTIRCWFFAAACVASGECGSSFPDNAHSLKAASKRVVWAVGEIHGSGAEVSALDFTEGLDVYDQRSVRVATQDRNEWNKHSFQKLMFYVGLAG